MFFQWKHCLLRRRALTISENILKWCIHKFGDSSTSSPWDKYGTMNISTYTCAIKMWTLMSEGTFCYPFCLRLRRLYGFLRSSWSRFLSLPFPSSVPVPSAVNQHFTREGLWKFLQLSKTVGYQNLKIHAKMYQLLQEEHFQNHHLHGLALTKICRWQISLLST